MICDVYNYIILVIWLYTIIRETTYFNDKICPLKDECKGDGVLCLPVQGGTTSETRKMHGAHRIWRCILVSHGRIHDWYLYIYIITIYIRIYNMVYRYIYMDITIYTNNYIDAWGYAYPIGISICSNPNHQCMVFRCIYLVFIPHLPGEGL